MLEKTMSVWLLLPLLVLLSGPVVCAGNGGAGIGSAGDETATTAARKSAAKAVAAARPFATLEAALRDSTLQAGQTLRLGSANRGAYGTRLEVVPAGRRVPDGIITYAQPRSGVQLVRRWDSTTIHAEWAGARPDYHGVDQQHTDNAKAFSKIEQFIRDHPSTTVKLDAGAYAFDTVWTFDNLQDFTIAGKGKGVTELVFTPRATYVPSTGGYEYERVMDRRGLAIRGGPKYEGGKDKASHGVFRDLTFRGHANAADAITTGVNFEGRVSHMTFENVEVAYFSGQGIRNGAFRDSGDSFQYLDSDFHHISTWEMLPSDGVGAIFKIKSNALIRGNRFWASGTSGLFHAIYFDGYGENIRVVDNRFISIYPDWDPAKDPAHEQIAFCDLKVAQHESDHPKRTGDKSNNKLYEEYNVFKNVTIKDNVFRNSFSNMRWGYVDSLTATNNTFEDTMLKITERATHVDLHGNTFTRSTNYRKITGLKNATKIAYIGANSMLKVAGAGAGVLIRNNTFRDLPAFGTPWPPAIEIKETGETSSTTFRGNRIEATRGLFFRKAKGGTVQVIGNTIVTRGQAPEHGNEVRGVALKEKSSYGGSVRSVGNTYQYRPGRTGQRVQIFVSEDGALPIRSLHDTFIVPSLSAKRVLVSERGKHRITNPTIRVEKDSP